MELTYEQIKAKQDAERLMHQWWTLITERERQEIVKGIRGCVEFGGTVTVQRMPEAGQLAVRDAYAKHLERVAQLERAHPPYEPPTRTDCCGNGPHSVTGDVRVMPSGGDSNLILCRNCWNRELAYRRDRNRELGDFAQFKLPAWDSAKVYEA